jgi:hypothetical protein
MTGFPKLKPYRRHPVKARQVAGGRAPLLEERLAALQASPQDPATDSRPAAECLGPCKKGDGEKSPRRRSRHFLVAQQNGPLASESKGSRKAFKTQKLKRSICGSRLGGRPSPVGRMSIRLTISQFPNRIDGNRTRTRFSEHSPGLVPPSTPPNDSLQIIRRSELTFGNSFAI